MRKLIMLKIKNIYLYFCFLPCCRSVCMFVSGICTQVCVYAGQRRMLGVLLHHSLPYLFMTGFLTEPWLVTSQSQSSSCLQPPRALGLQVYMGTPTFLHECWILNLDPHACRGEILPTESYLQPHYFRS